MMKKDVIIGLIVAAMVPAPACVFDPVADVTGDSGLPDAAVDSAVDARVDARVDASDAADALVDVVEPDAGCTNGFYRCNGDAREVCDNGVWTADQTCELGCDPAKRACRHVVASNNVDSVTTPNPVDWTVTGRVVVNTDNGLGAPGTVRFGPVQGNSCEGQDVDIGVFVVHDLVVQPGAELVFRGSNAVAIRALGKVQIQGIIRVSGGPEACIDDASVRCAGPGGFWGAGRTGAGDSKAGDGPGGGGGGSTLGTNPTGGGGGGHLGAGGRGGNDTTLGVGADGGSGGAAYGSDELQPLCGGSGGGSGGLRIDTSSADDHLSGGGGGGAIQITANESIDISCQDEGTCGIDAGGAGGEADHDDPYWSAGGGGGAGGAILLEAVSVQLTNGVLSVAGGGGGGGYNSGSECVDGEQAPFSGLRAAGGSGAMSGGDGAGGQGQDGTSAGDPGTDGDSGATGGGGGGAGRIHINTANARPFGNNGMLNPGQAVPGVLTTGAVAAEAE